MGRILDAIEDVEDDLERSLQRVKHLEEKITDLNEQVEKDAEYFKWAESYIDWLEAHVENAHATYEALQKIKE